MPVTPSAPDHLPIGPTLSRRRALQLLAGSVLASTLGVGCSDGDGGPDEAADHWAAVAAAARRDEPDLDAEAAVTELGGSVTAPDARRPTGARRTEVTDRIRADYGEGRTQLVDGWLLSRTEVLLAVVASEAGS